MALAFILPATIGFGVFLVWPAIRGIWLSFTDYSVFQPPHFIGLDNYRRMFADPVFWSSMRVTVYYVIVNIGVQTVVALVLAVLLNRLTKSLWVRGVVLTPYLVSNVVTAMLWLLLLDYQLGIVNQLLDWLGIGRQSFWGDPALVIPTIALVNVWRHVGYTALLIFAGLQTISPQIYEA
jgi:multiple sugar transport system permease protein